MRGLLLRCGHHVFAAGLQRAPLRALATSAADTRSPERAAQVSEEAGKFACAVHEQVSYDWPPRIIVVKCAYIVCVCMQMS